MFVYSKTTDSIILKLHIQILNVILHAWKNSNSSTFYDYKIAGVSTYFRNIKYFCSLSVHLEYDTVKNI